MMSTGVYIRPIYSLLYYYTTGSKKHYLYLLSSDFASVSSGISLPQLEDFIALDGIT